MKEKHRQKINNKMYGLLIILLMFEMLMSPDTFCEASSIPECPSPEDVAPCICTTYFKSFNSQKILITCTGLEDSNHLIETMSKLKDVTLHKLRIIRSKVTNLTENSFSGLAVKEIEIETSTILSISTSSSYETSAFFHLKIESLSITHCKLREDEVKLESLRGLDHLNKLNLNDNRLKTVSSDWFKEGMPIHLAYLHLRTNEIQSIQKQAFNSLKNLEFLDLSENRISSLDENLFPPELSALYLSYNDIVQLPANIFEDMSNLQRIYLDHNKIQLLEESVWHELYDRDNWYSLDLTGNPINCDCSLRWIPESGRSGPSFYFFGTCENPSELKGRPLYSLKVHDLKCPLALKSGRNMSLN